MKIYKTVSAVLLTIYVICLITILGCASNEKTAKKPPADSEYTPYHDTVSKNSSSYNSSGNTWSNSSSKYSNKTSTTQSTPSVYRHTCSFGNWQTVTKATCSEYGLEKRTCYSCGNVEQRTIGKTSCSFTSGICSICGKLENTRDILIEGVKTYGDSVTNDNSYYIYSSQVTEGNINYITSIGYDADTNFIYFDLLKSGDIVPYHTSIGIIYEYGAATQTVSAAFNYDNGDDDIIAFCDGTIVTNTFNYHSPALNSFVTLIGEDNIKHRELLLQDTAKMLYEINTMCTKINPKLTIQQLGFTNF